MEMVVCGINYFHSTGCAATSTQVECIVLNWVKNGYGFIDGI